MIDEIKAASTTALKAGDRERVGALRMLIAALQRAEKDAPDGELSQAAAEAVLRRERKQRVEAAEAYRAGGRPDRAESEEAEMTVIDEFLPAAMTDQELETAVDSAIAETGATSMKDMGRVMAAVTEASGGRADGRAASALVRARLQG
jgi:uncharacterized protein YqeY